MFAAAHQGESVIDVLNHIDVDYFTLGNHEFDFGAPKVAQLMGMSNFRWLGSNIRDSGSRKLFSTVLDTDVFDVKIQGRNGANGSKVDINGTYNGTDNGSLEGVENGAEREGGDVNKGINGINGVQTEGTGGAVGGDTVRVGVFGVCTQFTPMLSDPGEEVGIMYYGCIVHPTVYMCVCDRVWYVLL